MRRKLLITANVVFSILTSIASSGIIADSVPHPPKHHSVKLR